MLNPFPSLLIFSFFAPTLLRIAIALVLLSVAYAHYKRRTEIATTKFPLGISGMWIAWVMIIATALTAVALCIGYGVQWAALVGVAISLKGAVWAKRYPRVFPLCRLEYVLILIVCFSLLLTGAGALAFDLPL